MQCDWVHRFNEEGADGLINAKSHGRPSKPSKERELRRLLEAGPDRASGVSSHVSARPLRFKQDHEAIAIFKMGFPARLLEIVSRLASAIIGLNVGGPIRKLAILEIS